MQRANLRAVQDAPLGVNEAFTSQIVELARPESDAMLAFLARHIERNLAFQVRVHWTENALVVWDSTFIGQTRI